MEHENSKRGKMLFTQRSTFFSSQTKCPFKGLVNKQVQRFQKKHYKGRVGSIRLTVEIKGCHDKR